MPRGGGLKEKTEMKEMGRRIGGKGDRLELGLEGVVGSDTLPSCLYDLEQKKTLCRRGRKRLVCFDLVANELRKTNCLYFCRVDSEG